MNGSHTAPSGSAQEAGHTNLPCPSDRVPSRRLSMALQVSGPEGGFQTPAGSWWETEFPVVAGQARIDTAESGIELEARSGCTNYTDIPLWGRERSHLKGGGLTMRRILAVLSTLAALFLIGGATAKF